MNVVIPSKPPFKIWQIICFLSFKNPFSWHIILSPSSCRRSLCSPDLVGITSPDGHRYRYSFRFSDFFNPYVFLHLYVLHLHIYVLRTRQLEREAPQVNGPSSVCGSDHRPGRDGSSTVTDVHEIHDESYIDLSR